MQPIIPRPPATVLFMIIAVLISACQKKEPEHKVIACFTAEKTVVGLQEELVFHNCSENAQEFFWEYGNGESDYYSTFSRDPGLAPATSYTSSGGYLVQLIAMGPAAQSDTFSMWITVAPPELIGHYVLFSETITTTIPFDTTVEEHTISEEARLWSMGGNDMYIELFQDDKEDPYYVHCGYFNSTEAIGIESQDHIYWYELKDCLLKEDSLFVIDKFHQISPVWEDRVTVKKGYRK